MSNISHTNEGIKDINKNYNYFDIEQSLTCYSSQDYSFPCIIIMMQTFYGSKFDLCLVQDDIRKFCFIGDFHPSGTHFAEVIKSLEQGSGVAQRRVEFNWPKRLPWAVQCPLDFANLF